MLLDDIKLDLGITRDDKDRLLNMYIRRAVYSIRIYLNTDKYNDDQIKDLFSEAVISLAKNAYEQSGTGDKGIKSKSQGARSVTYMDDKWFAMNSDVKALLPLPYVKMR